MLRLPEDAQTLYAELLALLMALEGERGWAHIAGSFVSKAVGGRDYVYFQYSDPGGRKRQFAIGRRGPASEEITRRYAQGRKRVTAELEQIDRLARLLEAAGVAVLPRASGRVLQALADAGVFRLGGVVVGTYAFVLIGNMMGVRWPDPVWSTQDVDIASTLALATPALTADVPSTLESLEMGFVPVPQLDPRHASTSFKIRGKQLRVDLLTPATGKGDAPIPIPRLRAHAAPLKFLSLLMTDAAPAAAVSGGAALVRVPVPARFALHKVLTSQLRSAANRTKSSKDLHQAALLLELLGEETPEELAQAASVFHDAGPAVASKVLRGLVAIRKRWPEAAPGIEVVEPLVAGRRTSTN